MKKLQFVDQANQQVNIEIRIQQTQNEEYTHYETMKTVKNPLTFSISGSVGGCSGQCYNSIHPTPTQKPLIDFWKKYHLNALTPGTKRQMELIKSHEAKDYDETVKLLEEHNLLVDNGYKYGSKWLYRPFPQDELMQICDAIEAEERERISRIDNHNFDINREDQEVDMVNYLCLANDNGIVSDKIAKRIIALLRSLELQFGEYTNVSITNDTEYNIYGIDYYVGTQEELDTIAIDYLTDDDSIWREAVYHGNTTLGLQEWAQEIIDTDGCASTLNGYDGSYDETYVLHGHLMIIRKY